MYTVFSVAYTMSELALTDYGFCKFTDWCKFSHKMVTNNDRNDEVKKLEKNLEALENKVKSKDEK